MVQFYRRFSNVIDMLQGYWPHRFITAASFVRRQKMAIVPQKDHIFENLRLHSNYMVYNYVYMNYEYY